MAAALRAADLLLAAVLPDHYAALGVEPSADQATLRDAYLRIMRAHHPDRRPGDNASAERARRANAAYAVLSDQRRRAEYDRRHLGPQLSISPQIVASDVPPPATRVAAPAYSPERAETRRAFTLASVRFALTLFLIGLVLLVAFAPQ